MAGQPRKKAMTAEMERRAAKAELTPLEYALEWVESGKTLVQLTDAINKTLQQGEDYVTRSMVSRYLNGLPGGTEALAGARKEGAHGMAEGALTIIDRPADSREEIAANKNAAELRLKLAGFWNKGEYQDTKNNVNVQVNLPAMHLDALRQRAVLAKTTPLLPPAGPDVEVIDG